MAAKLTRLTHKIAIQLHPVAESCTICSSRSRRPVRELLDTPSYTGTAIEFSQVTRVGCACPVARTFVRYDAGDGISVGVDLFYMEIWH
jgi:hypothetical protein